MMTKALAFLKLVLPEDAPIFCASTLTKDGAWHDIVLSSREDILQKVFVASHNGANTYFALSGFQEGWHVENNKKCFRTQNNAIQQKCLWLDVDCGKHPSPYPDTVSGINALTEFLKKTQLPLPITINSGHGLHLYWPFQEAIVTAQWRQLATRLQALCNRHGFVVDTTRTCDPASVLRVPGTVNYDHKHKYDGVPRKVEIFAVPKAPYSVIDIARKLIALTADAPVAQPVSPPSRLSNPIPAMRLPAAPDRLNFGGMDDFVKGAPKHPGRIIRECEQVRTAGLGTYPQWYGMMTVMRHCEFGEQAVHDISKVDAKRYDADTTQRKYEEAIKYGSGPCRCDTFDRNNPGMCQRCPYFGKITSPIQLGETYVKPQTVTLAPSPSVNSQFVQPVQPGIVPEVPAETCAMGTAIKVTPYHDKTFSVLPGVGVVWHKKMSLLKADEEGVTDGVESPGGRWIIKDIVICEVELYIHGLCVDSMNGTTERSYLIRKQVRGRAPEELKFDINENFGTTKLPAWLANNGLLPKPEFQKQMVVFMSTYLASIQNKLPEMRVRNHFGWVENYDAKTGKKYDGFLVGDVMLTARGDMPAKLNDRAARLAQSLASCGNLEAWKLVPQIYRVLDQKYAQLLMCAAFGAPFMRLGIGTATNIAYSLWDVKGGKGKSSLLEIVASVWGDSIGLLQLKSDTQASRFQKYSVYKNIPMFVDEITTLKAENAAELIYDIVNGKEKSRSNSTGTDLVAQGTWATVTLFTSNKSLYDILRNYNAQSDATCMRVIEMQCDFKDYSGTPAASYISKILEIMRQNYGLAGPEFMRYMLKHPEKVEWLTEKVKAFVLKNSLSSDERFWMFGVAIPLYAGEIAVEMGLLDYDMDALREWVLDALFPYLRATIKQTEARGPHILSEFLNEHISETLTVRCEDRPADIRDTGGEAFKDNYVLSTPLYRIATRREMDTNTFYVSCKIFKEWCAENGFSLSAVLQDLQECGIWQDKCKRQMRLGKDVKTWDRSRVLAYRFALPEEYIHDKRGKKLKKFEVPA